MKVNQKITHEPSGESLTLLVDGDLNGGKSSKYEMYLPPHDQGPYVHFHTKFKEIFTLREGRLDFYLGEDQRLTRLTPGQSITAEIGVLHSFRNDYDEPAVFTVEGIPAGGFTRAFQLLCGIANSGGADKGGYPANFLEILYFVKMTQGYRRGMPVFIQELMFGFAALYLGISGRKKVLDSYVQ